MQGGPHGPPAGLGMTGRSFTENLKPDEVLRRSLDSRKAGDLPGAIFWAAAAAQTAGGPSFFESHALTAALLAQAGHMEAAMAHWDKLAISAPQKLQWLEPALRLAMRINTEAGNKYLHRWRGILCQVYLSPPSVQILTELEDKGLGCPGSMGIHAGQLRGWAWLKRNEKPRLQILDLPAKYRFQITLKAAGGNASHVLYSICEDLPKVQFRIILEQADGRPVTGSPLLCSPPDSAFSCKSKSACKDITVIIPVYDDAEATLACIGSVLASLKNNKCKPSILAVWDHGPDQNLLAKMRRLHERGKIRLLENSCNMGFLASVNHALGKIRQGDVLLLNADTLVHGDWLDRFRTAADAHADAATLTALGNEAELMSYPSFHDRGKIERLSQVSILDAAARKLPAAGAALEIPAGVGFCMLITRECLRRIGGLDGWNIFRGYGEETYYCLKAAAAGLKSYGLFNVFVGHLGERSFGLGKRALAAQNNLAIHEQFPGHRRDYETFLFHGGARQMRKQIAINSLAHLPRFEALEIRPWSARLLPPWARDEQCQPDRRGAALFLRPGPNARALLRVWSEVPVYEMTFDLPADLPELVHALDMLTFEDLRLCTYSRNITDLAAKAGLNIHGAMEPEEGSLPPLKRLPEAVLMAPPMTLHSYKTLLQLAKSRPDCIFYVFHCFTLWPNEPEEENLRELPLMEDYSPLGAEAFLMLDNFFDAGGWQEWLAAHHCGHLPVCRLPNCLGDYDV